MIRFTVVWKNKIILKMGISRYKFLMAESVIRRLMINSSKYFFDNHHIIFNSFKKRTGVSFSYYV